MTPAIHETVPPLPATAGGSMSPRQRVRTALAHQQPDRVPFAWGFGPTPEYAAILTEGLASSGIDWQRLRAVTSDTVSLAPRWTGPPPHDDNTFTGIWGIRTRSVDYGGGAYDEFIDFPLAEATSAADLQAHPWPSADHYDYASLRAEATAVDPASSRALQVSAGNPFEIYCWLTGMEQAMVNLATQPELVRDALGIIGDFMESRLRRILWQIGDRVDIVFLADDLGSQQGLLISRRMYVQYIQPIHARLCEAARTLAPDAFTMMHSDGAVFDILPDVIDAGVQVLEAVQTDADGMVPARLKQSYGDRLAFHGAISVQQLLPRESAATVFNACQELVATLGAGGGYVAAPSHAIQLGTPTENILAMLRAVLGLADYSEAIRTARRQSTL